MLAIRIFLGLFGVLLAVFLQAYGLPIFLLFTLLLGWWLERGRSVRQNRNVGVYGRNLLYCYGAIFILMIFAGFFEQRVSEYLVVWDSISYLKIETPEVSYEPGTFRHASAIFSMNLIAIITPIIVGLSFHELISSFPKKAVTFPRTIYLLGFALFFLPAFFALWGASNIPLNVDKMDWVLFFCFAFQSLSLLFLFRHQ